MSGLRQNPQVEIFMLISRISTVVFLIAISATSAVQVTVADAQTRDEKVLRDRESVVRDGSWYHDDIEKGFEAAAASKKPLMVVIRCIP